MKKTVHIPPHVRNGRRVGGYSQNRSAQWARAKSTWISAGIGTVTAAGILWELGVTIISVGGLALIAVLGTVGVMVARYVEHNRQSMASRHRTRRPTRGTTSSRARTSSGRSRAGSRTRNPNSWTRR